MIQRVLSTCYLAMSSAIAIPIIALAAFSTAVAVQLAPARMSASAHATPHLSFTVTASRTGTLAERRLSIVADVSPKPGMHVYALGSSYRPVRMTVNPNPAFHVDRESVYPIASTFIFTPLNEKVLAYSAPFRISHGIAVVEEHVQPTTVTLSGALHYQACDATVCYLPVSVPFELTVNLKVVLSDAAKPRASVKTAAVS